MSSFSRFIYMPVRTDLQGNEILDFKAIAWKDHLSRLEYSKSRAVLQEEENNLPLICYKEYRNVGVWWIVAMANNIFSPLAEVRMGRMLQLPTLPSMIEMLDRALPTRQDVKKSSTVVTMKSNVL